MQKSCSDIDNPLYGFGSYICEPSIDDIRKSIQEGNLETRSFQGDIVELNNEWNSIAQIEPEYYILQKE